VNEVLGVLKQHHTKTQLWTPLSPDASFDALPEREKIELGAQALGYLAGRADKLGCSVALYGNGGWMGEPENELRILQRVHMKNVGLVYNFEHGRDQMDRFAQFFPELAPHLMAVILNGMRKGGPTVITVGDGERELEMLEVIRKSDYHGPVGIMNLNRNRDAEVGLKLNMEGLKKLLRQMGDLQALQTY
jgi:hypothetical protein